MAVSRGDVEGQCYLASLSSIRSVGFPPQGGRRRRSARASLVGSTDGMRRQPPYRMAKASASAADVSF